MKKFQHGEFEIVYAVNPEVTNEELNPLFASAWENHAFWDFLPVLKYSLCYICAYHGELLVGYVNLAWDGAQHAFILDTTVHRDYQHHGIGARLVKEAVEYAKAKNVEWIHVDFEPHLETFYFDKCGFQSTKAGLLRVKNE
jgi:ribosomal protein S18 acetylase RimI-like enzyme